MKIIRYLKFIFYKIHFRKKKVYFDRFSYTDNSKFEGKNNIGKMSKVINSQIGFGTYLGRNVILNNTSIGKYCSVANRIGINVGQHPTNTFVSTSPAFYSPNNEPIRKLDLSYVEQQKFKNEFLYTKDGFSLKIGNDVWIGNDVKFKEGISVGDGAIIGSGSLVTKDVPSYAIVGGIPAKVIKYRFKTSEIEFLLKFKWWDKGEPWIKKNANKFDNIKKFMEKFNDD